MYESHFKFTSRPFNATPHPDCFFPNQSAKAALNSVVSCIQRAAGTALVVGGSGIGKSLFLHVLGKHFQKSHSVVILESASLTSRRELLQSILFELGLPYRGMEEGELRLTLMDYLKPSDHCPNGLLLCVDEAHLLQVNLLEEMRMITNLVREGRPRAQLVLAGNPSIEEKISDPKLESLNQRIVVRAYLDSMSQSECRNYIQACTEYAGQLVENIFDEDSIEAVFVATNGIPRLINQVCDHAMVLAVADGVNRITSEIINEAWSDIQRLPVQWHMVGQPSQTENEHVVEFGSLEDESSPASNEIDFSQQAEQGIVSPLNEIEESSLEIEADATADQPLEEEQKFVFEGPSNPFLESFPDEKLVVDSFSQVIGHSPLKPFRPANPAHQPKTENSPLESLSPQPNDAAPEEFANQDDRFPVGTENNTATFEDQSSAMDQPAELSHPPETPDVDPQESTLEQYLSEHNEAITFGVGQGMSSDSLLSQLPDPSEDSPAKEDNSVDHDSPVNQAVNPLLQEDIAIPDSKDPTNVAPLSPADFASLSNLMSSKDFPTSIRPSEAEGEAIAHEKMSNGQDEDETTPDENQPETTLTSQAKAAELINDSISGIQADLQSVSFSAQDENLGSNDDRDMIIVEPDPETPMAPPSDRQPDAEATKETDTAETENALRQAKREDYQRLFDRLRKG